MQIGAGLNVRKYSTALTTLTKIRPMTNSGRCGFGVATRLGYCAPKYSLILGLSMKLDRFLADPVSFSISRNASSLYRVAPYAEFQYMT